LRVVDTGDKIPDLLTGAQGDHRRKILRLKFGTIFGNDLPAWGIGSAAEELVAG